MTGSKRSRWLKLFTLLAAMLILAAACGEDATETAPAGNGSPSETEAPEFSTLTDGVLQVASCLDYRPFEFVKDDEEQGFDVELTEEIASRLGLEVQWVRTDFEGIFPLLAAGQFDMVAAASTITDERLQQVDFSDPYFNARQGFTVNTNETPDVTTTDQLQSGDVVGVQSTTTGETWANDNLAPNGIEVKSFTAVTGAFTDLEAGNVAGVINDEGSSIAEAAERPGLSVVQAMDTDEHYGFAFSKDNPELTAAANTALAKIIADGTYATIFSKWFPELPVPEEFAGS